MKVLEILGKSPLVEKEQNSPIFCLPKCYIGLEYEWENTGNLPSPPYPEALAQKSLLEKLWDIFTVHNDGSLRGPSSEFVFKEPRAGSRIESAIETMEEVSRIYKFTSSYRTSLHVHLDMQSTDFPESIILLGALYCLVEPFFYKFVGNNREVCNYCIPWFSHPQHYKVFCQGLLEDHHIYKMRGPNTSTRLKNLKSYKYSGLNLFSLGDFGTVEFRQAPVDMQKDKIIVWINAIMRLKKFVLEINNLSTTSLVTKIEKMGPVLFLQQLLGEQFRDITKLSRSIHEDFHVGLKTMYHFLAESSSL